MYLEGSRPNYIYVPLERSMYLKRKIPANGYNDRNIVWNLF